MKDENKRDEQDTRKKWRYFCEGCTNRAFYGITPFEWDGLAACMECGKGLEYKPENWMRLSKEEEKEINSEASILNLKNT